MVPPRLGIPFCMVQPILSIWFCMVQTKLVTRFPSWFGERLSELTCQADTLLRGTMLWSRSSPLCALILEFHFSGSPTACVGPSCNRWTCLKKVFSHSANTILRPLKNSNYAILRTVKEYQNLNFCSASFVSGKPKMVKSICFTTI